MAYAVVATGGRQYRVAAGDEFLVNRLDTAPGGTVELTTVLMVRDGGDRVRFGTPVVPGSVVVCEVVSHPRGKKVVVFKYRRRKHSKRTHGHRQDLTRLRVREVRTT